MLRRRTSRALAGAWLATAIAVLSAAPAQKFSVAVLRRDGLIIPFASFNGRVWSVAWPGSDPRALLPISLRDVPKGWWGEVGPDAPWSAWVKESDKQPLRLIKPVHVPIFCGAHLAIATDYRGAAPDAGGREPTVPKDGIATAGDVTIQPITQVSVNAPDAALMLKAITDKFNEEETLAANHFVRWDHPYSASSRERLPIVMESFFRATEKWPGGEFRTSYVEAVRRYPARAGDEGCGLLTFARAWVTEVPGKKPIVNLGARITYCDRADVSFMQPFGRVVLGSNPGARARTGTPDVYWIFQLSSWRDEFYSVARVAADGVKPVVVVAGGGCPKEPER